MEESRKINRRNFLRVGGMTGAALALGVQSVAAMSEQEFVQVTILHTNDVHSRIEPFPMDGSRNQGLGGVARRASLINQIRAEQTNVLLLDAGDIFQGTPYFNKFEGELEFKLMSTLRYDAATMGNHDFDNGLHGFHKQLPHANFPFLIANYDFSNTILHRATKPFKVFRRSGMKIGVFGVGIELKGLVSKVNYGETEYKDPVAVANNIASHLKNEENCDLVICLSHLGYKYNGNKISDQILAKNTRNIDLIIGGHTHTFLAQPEDVKNLDGQVTTINQVGFAGINLGRVDYYFQRKKGKRRLVTQPYQVSSQLD